MEKEGEFTAKKVILQIPPSSYFPLVPQKGSKQRMEWEVREDPPLEVNLPVMLGSL